MEIDGGIITKLQNIIDRLKQVEGNVRGGGLEWGSPATEKEIEEAEHRLGITLPISFRKALHIGSSLYFYYSLNDFIMPMEFGEIFSGGLSWDIKSLEFINEIMGECADEADGEEEKAYIRRISGLLQFGQSGNGDIYALDMAAEGPEKPVLYWEHETGDIKYLAESFQSYLSRIIDLYAVGDEIWQLEGFLEADGLNLYSQYSRKWKLWFENFLNTRLESEKQNLTTLFSYTLMRKQLSPELKEAYENYNKKEILQIIQEKLMGQNHKDMEKILITMAAQLVGRDAGEWTKELWKSIAVYPPSTSTSLNMGNYNFSSYLLAFLSAQCLDKEQAFHRVRYYLVQWAGNRLTGTDALEHMKFFSGELVIPWMEQQNMTSPYGWDQLFLEVKPKWMDLVKWSQEAKKKKVLIDSLALFVEREDGLSVSFELPGRQEVQDWLKGLKEGEILNTRKRKIDKIVEGIDLLYH